MKMLTIKENDRIQQKGIVESQKVGTDYILFLHDKNQIVNLNSTSSLIWELILDNQSFSMLLNKFISHFSGDNSIDENTLRSDATKVVTSLLQAEVIEVISD